MGFMSQFNSSRQDNRLSQLMGMARNLAGNDPKATLQTMANNGITCNLPDGRTMSISELLTMAEGKTPQQLLEQLGLS